MRLQHQAGCWLSTPLGGLALKEHRWQIVCESQLANSIGIDIGISISMQNSLANFVHQQLEVVNVFKAAVHAGKSNVGHFVELFQFAHDQFA